MYETFVLEHATFEGLVGCQVTEIFGRMPTIFFGVPRMPDSVPIYFVLHIDGK